MHTSTILAFLKQLKENNNKDWMHANKPLYQDAKQAFQEVVKGVLAKVTLFDETLSGVEAKNCIFRVNRDIRFSKDKRPYKENFGAAMAKGGKKSKYGCYYLHLEPNDGSFLAGGCYMPQSADLAAIRQEIDYNAGQLKEVLADDSFQKLFGGINGEELKTAPKGYPKDHPEIELLRKKSFTVWHKISDEQVLSNQFIPYAVNVFRKILPFNQFLNTAVAEVE